MKKRAKKTKKQSFLKRHTRRLLIHPASFFLLLCTGVFLAALTFQAWAINIGVKGRIPAPPITTPAVIEIVAPVATAKTPPTKNSDAATAATQNKPLQVINQQVTLSGECPKASHIVFYRNEVLAGVAQCIGDPTFSITLDLQPGLNTIKAQVFNITEDAGPVSQPIYIQYVPPVAQAAPGIKPIILSADYDALGFILGNTASWDLSLSGGEPPYIISVDWGDNTDSSYTAQAAGRYTISHKYTKVSTGAGYTLNITTQDNVGQTALLQLLTIIAAPGSLTAHHVYEANQVLNPSTLQQIQHKLWIVWPAYLIVLLMAISFWLGEREEYKTLTRFKKKKA